MSISPVPQPLPRIARFERYGFGLFLHWGLYSLLGQGEWVQHFRQMSVSEYERLAEDFRAKEFDAAAIARLAREAGARYVVFTTRHHDGFSLYDTRGLSDFDAPHSAAGRDLVAEFVEACRSEGLSPFLYHTTLDWRWNSADCDERQFNDYLDYVNASVEILCRNYGEIGGLWFDGNWSRKQADWQEDRLYAMIRKHQPEAMIINNTGMGARGRTGHPELDSTTFEQDLPVAPNRAGWPKYLAGEMCETMNGHWGVGNEDFRFKSPAEVIEHLCACRRIGANYLLNVGPTASGRIPDYEAAVLRLAGQWIQRTGRVIYDARPLETGCVGRDFVLQGDGAYYYFAFDLSRRGDAHVVTRGGGNGLRPVEGLPRRIRAARWIDNGETARFAQSPDAALFVLHCLGYDYGSDLVVRVAELIPED